VGLLRSRAQAARIAWTFKVAVVVLGIALMGCATYLGRARRAYGEGRYLEAAESLAKHEDGVAYLGPRQQVEYGMVRGLSVLELGDAATAHRWLTYALQVGKDNPTAILPEERAAIEGALARIEHPAPPPSMSPTAPPPEPTAP
jgi:hypothetical protein